MLNIEAQGELGESIEQNFIKILHSFKLLICFSLIKKEKFNRNLAHCLYKLASFIWETFLK